MVKEITILYKVPYRKNTLICILIIINLALSSCEDFVEVELPSSQLNADDVFNDSSSAHAAITAIYTGIRDAGIITDLSYELGNYGDELDFYGSAQLSVDNYYKNTVLPSDPTLENWWNGAYYQIYSANSILERVKASKQLSIEDKDQLLGEAFFIRALLHFYLSEIFGDIPYITTSAYEDNRSVGRMNLNEVRKLIVDDLIRAALLLQDYYISNERVRPNKGVVMALLARVYLYNENWKEASRTASYVIEHHELYKLQDNLDLSYLKESTEIIWQLSPGIEGESSRDGQAFIITNAPPGNVALTETLVNSFEENDLRRSHWIGAASNDENTWYYAFKYKQKGKEESSSEYNIMFRLAEQYLIRSEARIKIGDLEGAKADLNTIRNRAGLPNVDASNNETLINLMMSERRHELFTELGHRFFDLRRTGKLDVTLSTIKPGWDSTDRLFPIPENELLLNPNLQPQNLGY